MHIRVEPLKLGIVVMKNTRDIDTVATRLIRQQRYIKLALARSAHTFRPILQVRFRVRGNPRGVLVIARFEYRKDKHWLWSYPQPQEYDPGSRETMFYPDIVLNLAPYRRGNSMLGLWEVKADIAILREEKLEQVPEGRRLNFLLGLPYREIAAFQWEVVFPVDQRLTPTGELRRPDAQPERRQNVTVSVDDI